MALTDKLSAIADAIRGRLNTTKTMTLAEMPGMIENIGIGVVPSYWQSHLDSKTIEINSALSTAGENKSAFLWYTDAHWKSNHGMSPMLLKYLSKHTGMQKTFFGGDIANATSGEIATLTEWQELVKGIPNHHSVLGNHDNQVTDLPSGLSAFFIEPERTGDVVYGTDVTNGKNYYYIDNHIENTRYICLSTGRMWTYADELTWCIDVLNNTPSDWHIVVVSHLWLDNDYTNGGIITTPVNYTQVYLDLFDAYNYRESGTTGMHSTAYNFEEAKAKVEFIIGGHTHQDYDFSTTRGIPVILTECDAWQERDDVSVATKGTTTESCVYGIVANYAAKKVNVINVGRGGTRSVAIPDVVRYTNWAKVAYAQGSTTTVYNDGKGYSENVRINSSGTDTTGATGWDTTGYIPVMPGDIIRLKNCTVFNMSGITGTNRCRPVFYDSSFAYVTESASWSLDKTPPIANDFSPVYGDNGDVVQFKVPTNYNSGIRYMRMTVDDINEDSIITVNEEIDEPDNGNTPAYTNVLTTAVGFDGAVLDGKGYRDGVRHSTSSNAFSSVTGWDCTGLIPCKQGDVIRLKNISFYYSADYNSANSDRGRVVYHDESYTRILESKLSLFEVGGDLKPKYDGDGNIIEFIIPNWSSIAGIKYFSICAQDVNADSIITVNEEIV